MSDQAVPNAIVRLSAGHVTIASQSGRFEFASVVAGHHRLTAEAEAHLPQSLGVNVVAEKTASVTLRLAEAETPKRELRNYSYAGRVGCGAPGLNACSPFETLAQFGAPDPTDSATTIAVPFNRTGEIAEETLIELSWEPGAIATEGRLRLRLSIQEGENLVYADLRNVEGAPSLRFNLTREEMWEAKNRSAVPDYFLRISAGNDVAALQDFTIFRTDAYNGTIPAGFTRA